MALYIYGLYKWVFEVWDRDAIGGDDVMGRAEFGPLDQDPNGDPIRSLYFVQVFLFYSIQAFLFLFRPGLVAQTTSVGIHPKQCSHAKVVLFQAVLACKGCVGIQSSVGT